MTEICEVCGRHIDMQIFKDTGVCCERCRKRRIAENTISQVTDGP